MRLVKRAPERTETLLGTLLMNAPLRALEISRTGCLLESPYPIEAGTAGRLRLAAEPTPKTCRAVYSMLDAKDDGEFVDGPNVV